MRDRTSCDAALPDDAAFCSRYGYSQSQVDGIDAASSVSAAATAQVAHGILSTLGIEKALALIGGLLAVETSKTRIPRSVIIVGVQIALVAMALALTSVSTVMAADQVPWQCAHPNLSDAGLGAQGNSASRILRNPSGFLHGLISSVVNNAEARSLGGPTITSVSTLYAGNAQRLIIHGTGFGNHPAFDGTTPMFQLSDYLEQCAANYVYNLIAHITKGSENGAVLRTACYPSPASTPKSLAYVKYETNAFPTRICVVRIDDHRSREQADAGRRAHDLHVHNDFFDSSSTERELGWSRGNGFQRRALRGTLYGSAIQ